jgi:crotonobetaine/carnitine-CoA ligase
MVPDRTDFEARFGMNLVAAYGQTETSFVTFDTVGHSRNGSCGRPHPDWQVAVVDSHDVPVPPGELGEIVTRPKQSWRLFSGYFGSAPKTVEAWRNLWYHTGDAGHLDDDGWLYFSHRLSESIRRRGENISAYEVELIAESHADVIECAAIGMPSEFTEEEVMVVAMRRAGSKLKPADLLEHFAQNAPRHMVPRYIKITDEHLPRTPTEKISRAAVKQLGIGKDAFDAEQLNPHVKASASSEK